MIIIGARNLEILYNARGVEIDRLRSANEEEKNKYIAEIHKLRHENTLLKGHLERNQIKMEDCEQTSQNLSDANHALRKELDELKKNLLKNEKENNDLKSMNENSTMTIKQLHSELQVKTYIDFTNILGIFSSKIIGIIQKCYQRDISHLYWNLLWAIFLTKIAKFGSQLNCDISMIPFHMLFPKNTSGIILKKICE